jgi:hypothetical protein
MYKCVKKYAGSANSTYRYGPGNKKKSSTRKKIKRSNCSPITDGKKATPNTCYTVDILKRIRNEYNKDHPTLLITSEDPGEIWETLNSRLTKCNTEDCWLNEIDDVVLRKQIDSYIFAPDSPPEWEKNPNEWLTNYDILDVLNQYETAYPQFIFLGPSPIDFDTKINKKCVESSLCEFSVGECLKNGKTKIGIIFNTDPHDKNGSHWISMFIDLEELFVFYFDSTGDKIPKEVAVFRDRVIKQAKDESLKLKYYDNYGRQHQHSSTECGMYSLFFIITMLTCKIGMNSRKSSLDKRLKLFMGGNIHDKYVEKYRKIYFNKSDSE